MEVWLWTVIGIMAVIIIALLIKIYILLKAAKEIASAFADRLQTDTNTIYYHYRINFVVTSQ